MSRPPSPSLPTSPEQTLPASLVRAAWQTRVNLMLTLPDRWGQHTRFYGKDCAWLGLSCYDVAWMQAPGRPLSDACRGAEDLGESTAPPRLPLPARAVRPKRR